MYMCMFVLDNPDFLDTLLSAWDEVGIRGATILESTGSYRFRSQRNKLHMRYLPDAHQLFTEHYNYTLFVMVADKQEAELCLQKAEGVMGDLNDPNTGVFAAWSLDLFKGVGPRPAAR